MKADPDAEKARFWRQLMTRVTIDADLKGKLLDLCEPLELCDESGRILATVMPVLDSSDYGPLEPQISREELDRRIRNKGKTYTTEEVLAYLERL
jgi:hypothetical protein